jgi:CheY-like chemotaxis protein
MADNATGLIYLSQQVGAFQAGIKGLQEVLSGAEADAPELNGRLARYLRSVLPEINQGLASQLPMILTHKFPESLGVALFAPGGRPLLVNESFSTVFPFPWRMLEREIPAEFKLYLCQKGRVAGNVLELWPWHTMAFAGLANFLRLARSEGNSFRYYDLALYQVGEGAQAQEGAATFGFILDSSEEVALEMRMAQSRLRLLSYLGEFDEPAARLLALVERAKTLPGLGGNAGASADIDMNIEAAQSEANIDACQEFFESSQPLAQSCEEYPRGYIAVEEKALELQLEPESVAGALEITEEFTPEPEFEAENESKTEHSLEFQFSPEVEMEQDRESAHESSDVMLESIQEIIEDSILQSIHEPATEPLEQVTFNAAPLADEDENENENDDHEHAENDADFDGSDQSQAIMHADNEELLSCMAVAEFEDSHLQEESLAVEQQEAYKQEAPGEHVSSVETKEEVSFEEVNLEQSTQSNITALWQEYSDFEPPASHLEEEMVELVEPEEALVIADDGQEISSVNLESEQGAGSGPAVEASLNLRCLVVDDIPVNQKLVVLQLKRLGYKPDLASNGLEAMKLIEQNDYAMIFMDLDMPYMNGFEATGEIRKRELLTTNHLPVIGMVSYEREGERRSCIDGGMDDCMVKGVEASNLKEIIDGVLTRCSSQDSERALSLAVLEEEAPPSEEKQCREVKQFIENMNDVVSHMQKLVDSRDTQQIEKSGATVTGSLQVLNLSHIEIVLDEIIRLARKGDWPQVRLKYLKLKTLYMRSQAELKKQHPSAFNEMASH